MADVRIVHHGRDMVGEGLFWSERKGALFWVDVLGRTLHRIVLATGSVTHWTMPDTIGWVIEREHRDGLIAGIGRSIVELGLDPLVIRPIATLDSDMAENRINDAKADAAGRIWVGTMSHNGDRPDGALYRLDPGGAPMRVDHGYHVANGPAISADGRTLYHTDSACGLVYRFALAADGSLGNRTIHIAFELGWGAPDGMTTDAEDGLWVAHWDGGRVSRFDRDGRLERSIGLPASRITNCAFGGEALDRMFITSARLGREHEAAAGALFEVDVGVRGLPPYRFGG